MVASLVQLQFLRISYCSELEQIIAKDNDDEREIIQDSLGFPKLKTLSISYCDKLEYVFPVSVSPSLVHLETLQIDDCSGLKHLIREKDDEREIIPESLLNLEEMTIGHTNLREIHITDCKGAQDRRTGHELSLLSLETLHLLSMSSMPDMRCIWKGLVLSHLTTLKVYYCDKLTHVFTGSMVASLVQLQYLKIRVCSELEQIIAKDNDDEKGQILSGSDLQSLCFPKLWRVNIRGCNKLRSLFPVAMAAGLPKLKSLEVEDSSQLLGVFGQDDDASPVNVERQMVLPNLSTVWLKKLPSIVCFSLGFDDFVFPRLVNLRVDKCPKLTTKFARKTNGSTSAQSEVSQSS